MLEAIIARNPSERTYVEDVFSTYLYTGTGATQTITNDINLSGKGGLVWIKKRSSADFHELFDTNRGVGKALSTNSSSAEGAFNSSSLPTFNTNGFVAGINQSNSGATYASWTFRKAPKFFDVVTYTGDGTTNHSKTINHSLGVAPGMIIIKALTAGNWVVYHRSSSNRGFLNSTNDFATNGPVSVVISNVTASSFTVSDAGSGVNNNGTSYVAYLFAHDTTADGLIQCGTYTGNGQTDFQGNEINLGWEPQFVLIKKISNTGDWLIFDNMRGTPHDRSGAQSPSPVLFPNLSDSESNYTPSCVAPTSTGFKINNSFLFYSADNYIYMAIRRGPMRTPTDATKVYENVTYTGNNTAQRQIGSSVLLDAMLLMDRTATSTSWSTYAQILFDRVRGDDKALSSTKSNVESGSWDTYFDIDKNVGWDTSNTSDQTYLNKSGTAYVSHIFRRAPGFFDIVAYTGTGSSMSINHNLTTIPEMIIVKRRNVDDNWAIYAAPLGNTKYLGFVGNGERTGSIWDNTTPTKTQFFIGSSNSLTNISGGTYIAYLFGSLAGVSKVGSYTGTGTTRQIDCGFSNGARFVMIQRTDTDGYGWTVFDSARGIVSGNDPELYLTSSTAEVTNTDNIDPYSPGFQITSTAPAWLNANGGTYVYLAIA